MIARAAVPGPGAAFADARACGMRLLASEGPAAVRADAASLVLSCAPSPLRAARVAGLLSVL